MATNEYINAEVTKVIKNPAFEFPLNNAMAAAWILANYKGDNLKVFNMKNNSALCDFAVIATAQNSTQARSMIDEVSMSLQKEGASVISYEGYQSADWILLDTGDVIIHVFTGPARDVYDLDLVFVKNPQVTIPEEFYFSQPTSASNEKADLKGFF